MQSSIKTMKRRAKTFKWLNTRKCNINLRHVINYVDKTLGRGIKLDNLKISTYIFDVYTCCSGLNLIKLLGA